jgi:hypothetical protein
VSSRAPSIDDPWQRASCLTSQTDGESQRGRADRLDSSRAIVEKEKSLLHYMVNPRVRRSSVDNRTDQGSAGGQRSPAAAGKAARIFGRDISASVKTRTLTKAADEAPSWRCGSSDKPRLFVDDWLPFRVEEARLHTVMAILHLRLLASALQSCIEAQACRQSNNPAGIRPFARVQRRQPSRPDDVASRRRRGREQPSYSASRTTPLASEALGSNI